MTTTPFSEPSAPVDALTSLHRERARAASLIASVPGVVWEAWGSPDAASQRINFVSDYVTDFLGYSVDEWLATPNFWLEIVHPEDRERAATEAYAIFASRGRLGLSRFRWVAKNGRAYWVEARSTTICDDDGNPVGMRGVTFDISKQVDADRRFTLLADASAALAASLDLEQSLRKVTRLLVPGFADLCVIQLLQPDGRLAAADVLHADPGLEDVIRLAAAAPLIANASETYRRVLAGEPVLHANVREDAVRPGAHEEPRRAAILALGVRSALVVPLTSREGAVGALALVSCREERRYGDEDVAFAMELGRRCGVAVENARLFVAARTELDQRRCAEARLERKARQQEILAELGRVALGPSTARAVARRAVTQVAEVCGFTDVYVIEKGGAGLRLAATACSSPAECDAYELAARVVQDGAPAREGDLSAVSIAVPPRRFGALVARGGAWDDDERRFLELVANVLANATERERSDAALQQEKERLAVTLRSIADGVVATDVEGRVVLVNAVAEQLTGWAQADAIGRPVTEIFPIVHARTRQPVENPILGVLRTGGLVGPAQHSAVLPREGPERIVADSAAPIRDRVGNIVGAVLVFRDITDKERIDAELQRANTLESIGVLAGGIAHDFNNILTSVLANVSLARALLPPDHVASGRVGEAERAAIRARELTQQLLTFARGGAPVRTPTSLAAVVRESAGFVLSGSAIRARFGIDPHPWVVEVDAGQISQVVQNLVLNATQAMPDGGVVDIDVRNVRLEDPTGLPLPAGAYLQVDVADQGVGIERAHLRRIFDPFFTTKATGSGLGLATAYAIVQKHDGHIAVVSEPGRGARFSVYLPTSRVQRLVEAPSPTALTRGNGRVLVMDDDAAVRATLADLLDALGYTVELTTDGADAVAAYERALRTNSRFSCAVLDLTVPGGMGGLQTVRALNVLDPHLRAIVSSGYSEDPVMAEFQRHGFVDVLRKPYTMRELSAVLARVVGAMATVGGVLGVGGRGAGARSAG
ncbi:MAG: PAS domain S-box protein, partial [Pseudomonadota bacterium]|nr:PAS domain S-box protein [Pseudomonadota bacterium]